MKRMMSQLSAAPARRVLGLAYLVTVAVILASGVAAWLNSQLQERTAREVIRAHRVLTVLTQVETTMTDAETGQRGFLLTGEEAFLEPYLAATGAARVPVINRPSIAALLARAEHLTVERPAEQALLTRVRSLVQAKIAELEQTIQLHRAGREAAALEIVREGRGKRLMDELRGTLAAMRVEERRLLDVGERHRESAADQALWSAVVTGLVSLLTIALLIATVQLTSRRLARSEERFRTLVEASSSVVWTTDPHGAAVDENLSWELFTGRPQRHYRGYRWLAAVHPRDRESLREAWREGARDRACWTARARVLARNNRYRDMIVRGVPLFDESGAVREWMGSCADVTDLMRAEARLRRFAESNLIGVAFARDDGRIEQANDEYLRICGVPVPAEREAGVAPALDPARLAAARASGAAARYETLFTHPDGSTVPALVGIAPADTEGSQFIAFVLDLSEQKRAESALRRQQEDFRMLADNISQHAWTISPAGEFLWFNQRWFEFTGLDPRTPPDQQWQQAASHPAHRDRIASGLRHALARGEPWEDVIPLRGADGAFHWFLSRALPIRQDGEVVRWFGTSTDIDERLRMERELSEGNRRRDEFIATMAHELRNPLAPIQAGVEIMKLSSSLPPQLIRTRAIMDRQLGHLVRLLDDLLDVSRLSAGRIELRKETVALKAVVDSALEVSRLRIESGRHELEVRLPPEPLLVEGDLVRLSQVVSNLVDNAAKYTPDGGRVRLTLARDGGDALIEVSDNGIGIDPATLPHVFDLFSRKPGPAARQQGGIGIGLSIARQLVHLHGGNLTASSRGLGQGSTFTVRLPLAQAAMASAGAPARGAPAGKVARRVLILDDNVDAAQTLGALLELGGHEIELAHTGREAIERAPRFLPDVAFLDIGLPDMTGYDVARALRQAPSLERTRLVALTGWGAPQDRAHSREAGFDVHLTKPVNLEAIAAALPELALPPLHQA